jgi:hypothetical protein
MALGSTQPLVKMSIRNNPGGKGGRCVRLTTSPSSRAECHEIWAPKPPGTLWATPGLSRDCFTFFYSHFTAEVCIQESRFWYCSHVKDIKGRYIAQCIGQVTFRLINYVWFNYLDDREACLKVDGHATGKEDWPMPNKDPQTDPVRSRLTWRRRPQCTLEPLVLYMLAGLLAPYSRHCL